MCAKYDFVILRNRQRCNSMIAKSPFNCLFYIGSYCAGKHRIRKFPELNHGYGWHLLDHYV